MANTRAIVLNAALRSEYQELFVSSEVTAARKDAVAVLAKRLLAGRERYVTVSAVTGVPWFVIGAIHGLESGFRLDRHLHNGDPLSARTVHWPKGRPLGEPPFTWEQSAMDALVHQGLAGWHDWSVAGTLFKLEAYNGFGYRLHHPEVKTPYLWSFTTHYTKGKYGADRVYDPTLVSRQAGVVALFRGLEEQGVELWPTPSKSRGRALRAEGPAAPARAYPGRVIRRGDADRANVMAIQEALVAKNCGPLDPDGLFGGDTEDSVKLFQSRAVDRAGAPLGIDGRVGPLTWEALFGPSTVITVEPHEQTEPLVAAALAVAGSQVGVAEEPPFKNTGAQVAEYLKSVHLDQGNPWCAAFVYWCFEQAAKQAGVPNPVFRTGHCMTHWREAGKRGVRLITGAQALDDPGLLAPGQIFIMHYGQDKGHTGFVESVQGGLLETIEGNTNGALSREGDGVYEKRQRHIKDINVGFIDYASLTPAERPGEGDSTHGDQPTKPGILTEIAPLDPSMRCAGLLVKAVEQGAHEQPIWVDVPFGDLTLKVGAHALRANVGGRLLRMPVSYLDAIAICGSLGWILPTPEISDAIWEAATVKLAPVPMGDRSTPALSAIADRKMVTLELVLGMNGRMDAKIGSQRWGELCGSEGKDWVFSRRNLLPPRGGSATQKGAANYGWHRLPGGDPIQGLGPDGSRPWHDDHHYDYSQTLRPIQRMARRADGAEVDLLDVIARQGMPEAVLAPLRAAAETHRRSATR